MRQDGCAARKKTFGLAFAYIGFNYLVYIYVLGLLISIYTYLRIKHMSQNDVLQERKLLDWRSGIYTYHISIHVSSIRDRSDMLQERNLWN